jgi:hypothetical protein
MSESQMPIRASATAGAGAGGLTVPDAAGIREVGHLGLRSGVVRLLERVFSFPAMLGAFLIARVFYSTRAFSVDPDLWWHLKNGEAILRTHHWPTTDPYSFTVGGQPWMAAEWLGDVAFAMVARLGGVKALDILLIALGSAVLIALYVLATLRSGNCKAGFLGAALVCSLAIVSFNLRPQMLGYLFLVLTLIVLERFRQGHERAFWLLPPLFLIWINTHGSWIIGLGAVFAFWMAGLLKIRLGELDSKLWTRGNRHQIAFVFLLCLITLLITPYGPRLAMYPIEVASKIPVSIANIIEWQPLAFNSSGGKLFLGILVGFIFIQSAFRLRLRLEEFLLFLLGIVMACLHVRFLLLFVPFTAPLLAAIFARWLPPYDRRKNLYALNAILVVGIAGAIIYYLPSTADVQRRVKERFPVEAVNYIAKHPVPGPTYNSYFFGGYLVWALGPEHKVFIDGRSEIYERGGVLSDYMQIADLKPGALGILQSYGVKSCLIERDAPLATLLTATPEWRKVYSDDISAIYSRRDASNRRGTD